MVSPPAYLASGIAGLMQKLDAAGRGMGSASPGYLRQ
jgi:hypothetical protein